MKRSIVYPVAGAIGFLAGAVIGIGGRNCAHPDQPPLLQCATEDPQDVLVPAIALVALALVIVACVDVAYAAIKRVDAPIPQWRRWLYLLLLVIVALPVAWIAIEQSAGGFSDGDPMIILFFGTLVLAPLIFVEFIVLLFRRYSGVKRLIPLAVVATAIGVTYAMTGGSDLMCVRHSFDEVGCYQDMQLYIVTYGALVGMVASMFLPDMRDRPDRSAEATESIRR